MDTSVSASPSSPEGLAPQQPTMVAEVLVGLLGPLLSAGKDAYQLRQKLLSALDPAKPLAVAVLTSQTKERDETGVVGHELLLRVSNNGAHGVYLEHAKLEEPAGHALDIALHNIHGKIGFGSLPEQREADLQLYIAPGTDIHLLASMPMFGDERLRNHPYGAIELTYVVAGVASKPLQLLVQFAVCTS